MIISYFPASAGLGAAARLRRMEAFFSRRGWEVHVLCAPWSMDVEVASRLTKALNFAVNLPILALMGLWRRADVVFVTAPPVYVLFTAALIRALRRRAFVFEERDLLTCHPLLAGARLKTNPLLRWLEKRVLLGSDAVIASTPLVAKSLKESWPELEDHPRLRVVYSGFWRDDYEGVLGGPEPARSGPLTLVHTGWFYGTRSPVVLLEAVELLLSRRPGLARSELPTFRLLGPFLPKEDRAAFLEGTRQAGLQHLFRVEELGPWDEALRAVRAADVALLVTHATGTETAIPAKMFEYIALGRPILALTDDPLVLEMMKQGNLGWRVPRNDVGALADLLGWMVDHPEAVRSMSTGGLSLSRYDAQPQLERLEDVFHEVLAARS